LNSKIKKQKLKIENFSDLLDSLSKTEDKKKLLWKEAYQNSLDDRENAHILFVDLLKITIGNISNHLQFGTMMSKYLERMSKSNDQILKLAELIAKEAEENNELSADDIYSKIMET
jgi:monomeric isocitrate dehydrogenase